MDRPREKVRQVDQHFANAVGVYLIQPPAAVVLLLRAVVAVVVVAVMRVPVPTPPAVVVRIQGGRGGRRGR